MDESPNLSEKEAAEQALARKAEIIQELRALVKSPGWHYICNVLSQQAGNVLLSLAEAKSLDELLLVNAELREVKTYNYLIGLPSSIIEEFTIDLETSHGDE